MHVNGDILFLNICTILTNILELYHTQHKLTISTHRGCKTVHNDKDALLVCVVPIEHRYKENIKDKSKGKSHQLRIITLEENLSTRSRDYVILNNRIYQSNEDRYETPHKSYIINRVNLNTIFDYVQERLNQIFVYKNKIKE